MHGTEHPPMPLTPSVAGDTTDLMTAGTDWAGIIGAWLAEVQ